MKYLLWPRPFSKFLDVHKSINRSIDAAYMLTSNLDNRSALGKFISNNNLPGKTSIQLNNSKDQSNFSAG